MEVNDLRHKLCWFRGSGEVHIMEISEEEVDVFATILVLPPSGGLGHEPRNKLIDGRGGVVLSFADSSCTLPCGALQLVNELRNGIE